MEEIFQETRQNKTVKEQEEAINEKTLGRNPMRNS